MLFGFSQPYLESEIVFDSNSCRYLPSADEIKYFIKFIEKDCGLLVLCTYPDSMHDACNTSNVFCILHAGVLGLHGKRWGWGRGRGRGGERGMEGWLL